MMEEQYLKERLIKLEKRERIYYLFISLTLLAIVLSCLNLFGIPKQDIIRIKGIIVVDENNRERLLIGAPVPDTEGRIRDDLCNGLIILDEKGLDMLALGSPTPNPQTEGKVGKRISPATGIQINDANGNERAGYGVMENGRVVLGLDHETGEGVMLFILPDLGYSGLLVNGKSGKNRQRIFLGANVNKEDTGFLVLNDNTGARYSMFRLDGDSPRWEVYDKNEKIIYDALKNLKRE
ncbi:MAG: hypothetical protein JSV56_13930 [Methanomassiliicoccales archaeon]|nr:MAG: hypothetical protein JSV56_13930 [Methanomassiliicoccales archaeon]